jgi:sugar phosphate isomerase/epimerase
MRAAAVSCVLAVAAVAAPPLYVFDNGTGLGKLSLEEQVELAKRAGYAGLFYTGTRDIPRLLAAHKERGLKVLGIYTGMKLGEAAPAYEDGLPEAIDSLRGSGALIAFTVSGKAANGDELAVPVVREVCDRAARAGLKVALYPHHGFHIARVEDALRLREKVGRANLGIVFNLCHWLRSGDEANMTARLRQALPHTWMVSVNGADHEGDWSRLIQPLDRGEFDVGGFIRAVRAAGYKGPFGLQCYAVPGDREENLSRSMKAWRSFFP